MASVNFFVSNGSALNSSTGSHFKDAAVFKTPRASQRGTCTTQCFCLALSWITTGVIVPSDLIITFIFQPDLCCNHSILLEGKRLVYTSSQIQQGTCSMTSASARIWAPATCIHRGLINLQIHVQRVNRLPHLRIIELALNLQLPPRKKSPIFTSTSILLEVLFAPELDNLRASKIPSSETPSALARSVPTGTSSDNLTRPDTSK